MVNFVFHRWRFHSSFSSFLISSSPSSFVSYPNSSIFLQRSERFFLFLFLSFLPLERTIHFVFWSNAATLKGPLRNILIVLCPFDLRSAYRSPFYCEGAKWLDRVLFRFAALEINELFFSLFFRLNMFQSFFEEFGLRMNLLYLITNVYSSCRIHGWCISSSIIGLSSLHSKLVSSSITSIYSLRYTIHLRNRSIRCSFQEDVLIRSSAYYRKLNPSDIVQYSWEGHWVR